MKALNTPVRPFVLLGFVMCISQASQGQILDHRLIYSRETAPNGAIWLNDGNGADSLLIADGQAAKIEQSGRYIFYMQGTTVATPYLDGTWMRYSTTTGTSTLLFTSTDNLVGESMVQEDSSNVVSYYCSIYHNDFNNNTINTVSNGSCYDDAPDVRTTEPRVVFHNAQENLFTVHLDGTERTAIPNTTLHDTWPSWSPDGQWILFGRCNYAHLGADLFYVVNFYKIKPSGDSLMMITQNDTLGPTVYTSNAVWNADGSAIITAGMINGSYSLMAIAADGSGEQQVIPTTPGDTIAFVSGTLDLDVSTVGINGAPDQDRISVWPVPANEQLNISLMETGPWHARLVDTGGRIVRSMDRKAQRFSIPLSGLTPGAYRLEVSATSGKWSVGRTVVKE